MSIGTADIAKAIFAVWNASGLESTFRSYQASPLTTEFQSLCDQDAASGQPFPYCVLSIGRGRPTTRTSGRGDVGHRNHNEVPVTFMIHTKSSGSESAKNIAASLMAAVLAVFGGHPETTNQIDGYSLDYGTIQIFQLEAEFGEREDIENFKWTISYNVKTDIPVA